MRQIRDFFLYQKSLGTNFGVHSMQRIEKTWKERRESFSGTRLKLIEFETINKYTPMGKLA